MEPDREATALALTLEFAEKGASLAVAKFVRPQTLETRSAQPRFARGWDRR